jgi:hypothetical protein
MSTAKRLFWVEALTASLFAAYLLAPVARAGQQDSAPPGPTALQPVVEIEEDVYTYLPVDNGAGPLWCRGSTCLVRIGADVFASGLETLQNVAPLNNCRWTLYKRTPDGWKLQQVDRQGRTREPCPLVGFPDGRLFLSGNPTLTSDPEARSEPARPEIVQFAARDPAGSREQFLPAWDGNPRFTEHSYRSFAADAARGEMILFQNVGYTHAEWAFRDSQGKWSAQGKLSWPWGTEYDKPQPIRVCYPTVALKDRAVHFCGVSDIVEPYTQWRAYKKEITGRDWDYNFRRLFYTWTPDITSGKFSSWIEIASRDKTAGWITPCDLWAAPDGIVHLLWTERALDERLQKKFFPDAQQSYELNYAQLRDGKVVLRSRLLRSEDGNQVPAFGRFQVTPESRLLVVFYLQGRDSAGNRLSENRVMEIRANGTAGPSVRLPLVQPFNSFFTATTRAGSPPSRTLEMLGQRALSRNTISYARIRL